MPIPKRRQSYTASGDRVRKDLIREHMRCTKSPSFGGVLPSREWPQIIREDGDLMADSPPLGAAVSSSAGFVIMERYAAVTARVIGLRVNHRIMIPTIT